MIIERHIQMGAQLIAPPFEYAVGSIFDTTLF
jgi:hypothetical protein